MLLVRVDAQLVLLPLAIVRETMRALDRVPVAGPAFVLGLSAVRGVATPVLDLGALLAGGVAAARPRLVSLVVDGRPIALAVDEVRGVVSLPASALESLPPLVAGGPTGAAVDALAHAGAELLLVLRAGRLFDADIVAIAGAAPA
jgi:chemotaxis signal transduction protein